MNIEVRVPAPSYRQAKVLVGATAGSIPAEPAWTALARAGSRAWSLAMVAAVAVLGWWSAVQTPDVARPQPAPADLTAPGPAKEAAPPAQLSAGASAEEERGSEPQQAREAYIIAAQTAAVPVSTWLVPLLLLIGAAALTLVRRPAVVERDSVDFRQSLANWLPLVAARQNTPREVKRFVNRVRLLAMRQRAQGADATQLDEPTLVALGALHHVDESLLLASLPVAGTDAAVGERLARAGHAWGSRIAAPLDAALATHGTDWPPAPEQIERFSELVGSVRLD